MNMLFVANNPARGMTEDEVLDGARRSSLDQATAAADKVLVF